MKERKKVLLWLLIVAVLLAASIITGNHAGQSETIQQTMRDAVLHNENRIDLLGWKAVNPGLISGFGGVHLRRGRLYLCGHPVRTVWPSGHHHRRTGHHPARPPV